MIKIIKIDVFAAFGGERVYLRRYCDELKNNKK